MGSLHPWPSPFPTHPPLPLYPSLPTSSLYVWPGGPLYASWLLCGGGGGVSIFIKDDVSISDTQVEKLNRELNIQYIACIGSLIHFLFKKVDLSFSVQKLAKFSSNPGSVHF